MTLLLEAPLKTTLVLSTGTGNPTDTRATAKRVFDNEGKSVLIRSGGMTFTGARVVQNFFANSGNMTAGAEWAVSNMTKTAALDPAGAAGGVLCTVTANAANYIRQSYTAATVVGDTKAIKFLYKPGTAVWTRFQMYDGAANRFQIWINMTTHVVGTASNGGTGWAGLSNSLVASSAYPGWYEITLVGTSPESGTYYVQVSVVDNDNTAAATAVNGSTFTLGFPQLENLTGRAVKTPNEYVSTGVLADPWHGGGVDGIKYFDTNKNGTEIPEADLKGLHIDPVAKINTLLWCRDFTNAVWTASNITPLKTQTGITGQTNTCSLLTATASNGTILQSLTIAAAPACSGFWMKRSVGNGTISITRDGGSNWTDVTSLINPDTFSLVKIENTSVLNPSVGIKISTSGDAVIVDAGLNHLGTQICEPIFTTTASVTRNAEVLTYQTASNFSDTAGTIVAIITRDDWTNNHDGLIGATTAGLGTLSTNSGVKAFDGLNTINGPLGAPVNTKYLAIRWSGTTLEALSNGIPSTAGSYDGSFGLATIGIGVGSISNIKNVKIYDTALTNVEISEALGLSRKTIWDNDAAMSFFSVNSYGGTYNDAMLKWLQAYFSVTGKTLPDLVARYIALNGPYLP